jgi:hypothetical protein
MLQRTEAIAEAGAAAKRRAEQLVRVSIGILIVGTALYAMAARKRRRAQPQPRWVKEQQRVNGTVE